MSLHRRAARVDGNHAAIVAVARELGATVCRISGTPGAPDLLVGYRGFDALWEIKMPRNGLNPLQASFHAAWRGRKPYIVRDPTEVVAILRDMAERTD